MRRRYLVAWSPDPMSDDARQRLRHAIRRWPRLAIVVDEPGLFIASESALPAMRLAQRGFVLGTLHDRGARSPARSLPADDVEAILHSDGARLIERYWGSYVALWRDDANTSLSVIRAPFGDLGCYCMRAGPLWLVGSDAALLASAGDRPALDWAALARHLADPELVAGETCLTGVRELRGGDRLDMSAAGTAAATSLWSPWRFAMKPEKDPADALVRVRDAVRLAVTANAAPYSRIVLLQSGGLDSSIVAACLHEAGKPFGGLNLVTGDPIGDERGYARAVSSTLGTPLVERDRDPAGIDFMRSLASDLPRPMARAFAQESERLAQDQAKQDAATAIFDGSGGDNMFCSHRSVAAAADVLLSHGLGHAFLATARALGDLTATALPQVVWRAMRRGWWRPAAIRHRPDLRLLAPPCRMQAQQRATHPWFVAPSQALPGRALHVSLMAYAQAFVEATGVVADADRVSPLIAQPVAEACLAVPSASWFQNGNDRAAARQAFADLLPAIVVQRRTKGSPAPFVADLLVRRRKALRPFMLDGALAGAGLLDCDAARRFFDDPLPIRDLAYTRMLTLIDAEAWARNWA